jgi:hypothetical protein
METLGPKIALFVESLTNKPSKPRNEGAHLPISGHAEVSREALKSGPGVQTRGCGYL